MAKPVYTAPALDLAAGVRVAAMTWVTGLVGSTVGFQALMVPSRAAKIKTAGPDLLFSVMVKSFGLGLMFPTMPVGVPRVPAGTEGAGGIDTKSGTCAPAAVYRVENPLPLSLTQYGLVGSETRPQPLTRC